MKFEDLYSKANDNIHADRKIIDSIFDKASHRVYLSFKPAVLCVAAVVLVIFISLLPVLNGNDEIEESKILYNDTNQNHSADVKKQDIPKTENKVDNHSYPAITNDTPKHNSAVNNSESELQYDNVSDNNSVYTPVSEFSTDEMVSGGSAGGSSGGSAGASMLKSSNPETTVISMTHKEYADYLNWDITGCNLALPQGMKMSYPDEVSVTKDSNGNIIDDTCQYVFYNTNKPNEFLSVSTSLVDKNIEKIYNSSERISVCDKEVVLMQNDTTNEAYTKTGNVWLHILSIDVTNEEFVAFLQSLIQ